jgi:hypothetical protein
MQVEARPTESPPAGVPPRPTSSPDRRRPWRLVLALGLAALAVAFGLYVGHYMPLVPANGAAGGQGSTDLGTFESPSGEIFGVTSFAYEDGKTFYFGFGLHNEGPLPVTITGIQTQGVTSSMSLSKETIWMASHDGWYGPPDSPGGEPFRTFSLGSGEERWIVIAEQMANCTKYGLSPRSTSTQTLARADVSYRVLGFIPRHAVLPYADTTQIVLTGTSGCS